MFKQNPRGTRLGAEDCLCFLHFEKTAGTTITNCLSPLFQPQEICPERYDLRQWPRQSLEQFRFIATHADLSDFDRVTTPKKVVTFLRDPVLRSLSLYQYWTSISDAQIAEHNLFKPRFAKTLGLHGLFSADNKDQCAWVWNQYAAALAGPPPEGRAWRSDTEMLDQALANLEGLDFVGLTENFGECYRRMCQSLGIPNLFAGQRDNVTLRNHLEQPGIFERTPDTPITDDDLALIRGVNTLDQQIYDHVARQLFPDGRLSYPLQGEPASLPTGQVRLEGDERWVANREGGFLMTGPYIRMLPGRYRATFRLRARQGAFARAGELWGFADVTSHHGENVITRMSLTAADVGTSDAPTDLTLYFTLPNVVNDLECRIFAEAGAPLETRCSVILTHGDDRA